MPDEGSGSREWLWRSLTSIVWMSVVACAVHSLGGAVRSVGDTLGDAVKDAAPTVLAEPAARLATSSERLASSAEAVVNAWPFVSRPKAPPRTSSKAAPPRNK